MRSRPSSTPPTTRRAVLRAALGLAGIGALGTLTGCEVLGGGDLPPPPDELAGFLTSTIALGNRYDQVIKAVPELADRLEPIRDAHRAHVQALAAAVGVDVPTPDTGRPTPPEGPEEAIAELAEAEQTARDEAVDACLGASARLAPLVGAIAAARATHVEVLT